MSLEEKREEEKGNIKQMNVNDYDYKQTQKKRCEIDRKRDWRETKRIEVLRRRQRKKER